MGKEFSIVPRRVARVETRYRRIVTDLPAPDSVPILEKLRKFEPVSMRGQPPVVWDRADDVCVYDRWGNMWLDWSSGVLVANCGHGASEIRQAIVDQVNSGLLHNYCFPSEERAELVEYLASLAPDGLKKVFLLTTGAEATENALKVARTHGIQRGGKEKISFVGFERGFHGRTLGAQQVGGMAAQKAWIVNEDPAIIHVPFPDGYWTEDTSFSLFCNALEHLGVKGRQVCGVMLESYQGVGPDFAPEEYIRALSSWCEEHDAVLIFDEIQAGFGRTGKMWGFEHYGVAPDLICFGKGLRSIQAKHPDVIGHCTGRGLVAGLQMVRKGKKEPNPDLAFEIIERCFHKGLLFFAPVGAWGQTVKIAPPLTITRDALEEGLDVLEEAVDEAV